MTAYVAITKNEDGGFRVQLRDGLANTRPRMQSAREPDPSKARRLAERLFGPLDWRTGVEAGLGGQSYVIEVAVIEIGKGKW